MKIWALLSWYDESPSWLASCVAGIGRWCDGVIACDGGYFLYPQARPRSHPQQAEAVQIAAETANLDLLLYQPSQVWAENEVGKRTFMLNLAGSVCGDDDWIAVIDADYHLLKCDPEAIRYELERTPFHVASYTLYDGKDFLADERLAEYVNRAPCNTDWTTRTRDIHRWNPSLRIGPQHWTWSAVIDGERRWVRGPWNHQVDCLDLNSLLVMYHRTVDRAKVRRDAAGEYYRRRDAAGVEFMATQDVPSDEDAARVLAQVETSLVST